MILTFLKQCRLSHPFLFVFVSTSHLSLGNSKGYVELIFFFFFAMFHDYYYFAIKRRHVLWSQGSSEAKKFGNLGMDKR